MSAENMAGKKRGPKGGVKHQPGRAHERKSGPAKKKRFARRAAKKRKAKEEEARRQWAEWDSLPDEQKKLLGAAGAPKVPRPKNED